MGRLSPVMMSYRFDSFDIFDIVYFRLLMPYAPTPLAIAGMQSKAPYRTTKYHARSPDEIFLCPQIKADVTFLRDMAFHYW